MDPRIVIERLGGVAKVAQLFGIKAPSVYEWMQPGRSIPKARLQLIALVRPDALAPAEPSEASNG